MTGREKLIKILESVESAFYWNSEDKDFVEKIADYLLANDAVPVVRCKDCLHRADVLDCGNYLCNRKMIGMVRPNDFCSFGERRTDA